MTAVSSTGLELVRVQGDDQLMSPSIPVDLSAGTPKRLYRLVTGALMPGDLLDIDADARVTNDCGRYNGGTTYTIGVGWHLWAYSYTNPLRDKGPWWRISHYMGDNVDPIRHHMPLHISRLYQVPADWPAGDRMVIVLQADAHSTQWTANGGTDQLTADDGYGQIIVRHWAAPTA